MKIPSRRASEAAPELSLSVKLDKAEHLWLAIFATVMSELACSSDMSHESDSRSAASAANWGVREAFGEGVSAKVRARLQRSK